MDNDGIQKMYVLGFYTYKDHSNGSKPTTYYLDDVSDSSDLVITMINELLRDVYKDIHFYCHNYGRYDVVYILSCLLEYNERNPDDVSKCRPLHRDDAVIELRIYKGANRVVIKDSYAILPSSLSKLGKDFEVKTLKTDFPHKFSTTNHLFYVGDKPSFDYYTNISKSDYDTIPSKD